MIPFFKDVVLNFGWFFVIFGAFIIVGAGNAVNLTDGLDGLAIVPVMIAAASFGMIAYLAGNAVFSDYLQINYVAGTGELAVLCGAVLGAGLGFLWFNAPPASIFMGDTGSLALGGMLGSIAVAVKHEIVLAVIGGLFVLEAVSVIVQVASFKLTGKRIFRMAPIHHHFEQIGLDRTANRDPVLDHLGDAGAGRPLHAEAAVTSLDPRHLLRGQDGCGVRPRRIGARELPRLEGGRGGSDRQRRRRRQTRRSRARPALSPRICARCRGRISPLWC